MPPSTPQKKRSSSNADLKRNTKRTSIASFLTFCTASATAVADRSSTPLCPPAALKVPPSTKSPSSSSFVCPPLTTNVTTNVTTKGTDISGTCSCSLLGGAVIMGRDSAAAGLSSTEVVPTSTSVTDRRFTSEISSSPLKKVAGKEAAPHGRRPKQHLLLREAVSHNSKAKTAVCEDSSDADTRQTPEQHTAEPPLPPPRQSDRPLKRIHPNVESVGSRQVKKPKAKAEEQQQVASSSSSAAEPRGAKTTESVGNPNGTAKQEERSLSLSTMIPNSSATDGALLWGEFWNQYLADETKRQYFVTCMDTVQTHRKTKKVYPPEHLVFEAFRRTPIQTVKVVVVGQDPYHQPGQAMGLSFSVPRGVKIPPSLRNIFKEIGIQSAHGDLTTWADQGVFLLNSALTVVEGSPMQHHDIGWTTFTDKVIAAINAKCRNVVFLLWGKPAQKKAACVDREKHYVLEAGHPSPLSQKYFLGCRHFVQCNDILRSLSLKEIDWKLPP